MILIWESYDDNNDNDTDDNSDNNNNFDTVVFMAIWEWYVWYILHVVPWNGKKTQEWSCCSREIDDCASRHTSKGRLRQLRQWMEAGTPFASRQAADCTSDSAEGKGKSRISQRLCGLERGGKLWCKNKTYIYYCLTGWLSIKTFFLGARVV